MALHQDWKTDTRPLAPVLRLPHPAARLAAPARALAALDWATLAAFGLPFLLYVLTLAPTVYNLDSAELTTAAATGGIMRATGYPLYLILGRLWSWLPVGDVGYRLNLFSAFCAALTVALAERILRRLGAGPWARAAALGLLACAPHFWSLALIAEVYTLHTALMAALILALIRWGERPTPGRLAVAAGLAGLGLSHHVATVLLAPGCAWYVLSVAPRRALAPRALAAGVAALGLGLSLYLYLALRYSAAPAFNYAGQYDAQGVFHPANLQTPAGLWWLISGRSFAGQMWAYGPAELLAETQKFLIQLWGAFVAVGIGPGLLGLATLLRRRAGTHAPASVDWRLGVMLLLMFACSAMFYAGYRVTDKDTMFLPTYLVWALWLGVGLQVLLDWLHGERASSGEPGRPHPAPAALPWLARGLLIVTVAWAGARTWPLVDLARDWSARERGEALLHALAPGALVFGDWDTIALIQYLQLVEGQRPDVLAINRFLIGPDEAATLIFARVNERPVYINYPPRRLAGQLVSEPVGPLYRLRPRPPRAGPGGGP